MAQEGRPHRFGHRDNKARKLEFIMAQALAEGADLFRVAAVDGRVLEAALLPDFADFEDAVVHEAAMAWGAAEIVTRHGRDFGRASLSVFEPEKLIAAVAAVGD